MFLAITERTEEPHLCVHWDVLRALFENEGTEHVFVTEDTARSWQNGA